MKKYNQIQRPIVAVQMPKKDSTLPIDDEIIDFLDHYGFEYMIDSNRAKFVSLLVSTDGHTYTKLEPTLWLYVDYKEGINGCFGDMSNDYFKEQYEEANDE